MSVLRPPKSLGTISVMLVEDDAMQQIAIASLFEKANELNGNTVNFVLTVASSSSEALDTLKGGLRPQIVVLDVFLPDLNGHDLLPTLRGATGPDVAIVMASAYARNDLVQASVRRGANSFLSKPVPLEAIRHIWQFLPVLPDSLYADTEQGFDLYGRSAIRGTMNKIQRTSMSVENREPGAASPPPKPACAACAQAANAASSSLPAAAPPAAPADAPPAQFGANAAGVGIGIGVGSSMGGGGGSPLSSSPPSPSTCTPATATAEPPDYLIQDLRPGCTRHRDAPLSARRDAPVGAPGTSPPQQAQVVDHSGTLDASLLEFDSTACKQS